MNAEKTKVEELHWLVRPDTIRKLWISGCGLLGLLVVADLLLTPHPYFAIDGTFGFYAWYGFLTCTAMVVGAKALSLWLKRDDTFYDAPTPGSGDDNV